MRLIYDQPDPIRRSVILEWLFEEARSLLFVVVAAEDIKEISGLERRPSVLNRRGIPKAACF
jgi:hypothetical protein